MDTTITDMAHFAAGYVRGDGLSAAMRRELVRPQLPITTASQFPTLQPELPVAQQHRDLAAGLGVVTFRGPRVQASTRAATTMRSATPWCASSGTNAAW